MLHLHVLGWDADDIDNACQALNEACSEGGAFDGSTVIDLEFSAVRELLRADLTSGAVASVLLVAETLGRADSDAAALREALYDLDAFAYKYAGRE